MNRFSTGLRRLAAPEQKLYQRFTPQPFRAGDPVFTDWNEDRAVKHGMLASSWVYRLVTMVMESGSTVPFVFQRRDATSGDWQTDKKHELSQLLEVWNDDFSAQESLAMCLAWLLLGGNALVGKFYVGKRVAELVAESPVGVRPIPNGLGGIGQYEYWDGSGGRKTWEATDLCHGRLPNPENRFWGLSRLRALSKAIDTDAEAVSWNKRRIEVGGVPDGILVDSSITSPTKRQEAQREIDETWRDIAGPFVTGAGVDWIQLGLSQNDLQWLEGRKFTMREICIGFGFNPALFGEDATYNNSEIAEKSKWKGAIIPLLNILAQAFSRGLIDRGKRLTERIQYDVSGVEALREDVSGKVTTFVAMIGSGTPYDVAKDSLGLDLPDLPNGQGMVPLVSANFQTLRSLIETELNEPEPEKDPKAPAPGVPPADPAAVPPEPELEKEPKAPKEPKEPEAE